MKITRATPEDINALADLASAVEAMFGGNIPPQNGAESDEWEYLGFGLTDLLNGDWKNSQPEVVIDICRRCLLHLSEIIGIANISRAAYNLEAVFLPENQIINLEADTLETHPSINQGRADTARLDWLADPENTIGKVMLPGWCSGEYDSLRDAIDAIINSPTYLEHKYGKTKSGRLFVIFEEIFNNKEKAVAGKDVTRSLITGQPINKEQP